MRKSSLHLSSATRKGLKCGSRSTSCLIHINNGSPNVWRSVYLFFTCLKPEKNTASKIKGKTKKTVKKYNIISLYIETCENGIAKDRKKFPYKQLFVLSDFKVWSRDHEKFSDKVEFYYIRVPFLQVLLYISIRLYIIYLIVKEL